MHMSPLSPPGAIVSPTSEVESSQERAGQRIMRGAFVAPDDGRPADASNSHPSDPAGPSSVARGIGMAFANNATGLLVGMNMDPRVWHNVVVDAAELGWSFLLSLPIVHHSLRVNELFPNPSPATPASPKSPPDLVRY